TIHASNTKNFVTRLASLLNASGQDVSITAAKQMIAEAFDYVIFQEKEEINEKTKKKKQMIKEIAEIKSFDEKTGEVIIENIFEYKVYGVDEEGNKIYKLEPTGVMPEKLFKACKDNNIPFDEKIFRKMFNL
ncbi:MAG: CpaF/VirB11 family protein, partial [Chitinispirillaceae bacterium]|nr:CpaF/VirB11 family protein [Chitinispirillaceae bacterium]